MKKIISLLCCFAMLICVSAVPAFAAETSTSFVDADTANSYTISPMATSKGLWYEEDLTFIDIHSFNVTPEKGANLNIWLKNDNPVVVTVYKTNIFGGYSKVYGSTTFSAGERDVCVETNCNGKPYLVKFESALDGSTMSILVYQN